MTSKPTFLGKLRRVSSFSSSPASPSSPTSPTSPTLLSPPPLLADEPEVRPQDIPRSQSVMSWFSDDSENEDAKRPWKMPKLRRKARFSPKSPTFTFTTSASSVPSAPSTPVLHSPLLLSSESLALPPVDLDLALDFDCAFPRPDDSDASSNYSSPTLRPSSTFSPRASLRPSLDVIQQSMWYEEEEDDCRTLSSPTSSKRSSDVSRSSFDWTDGFAETSPRYIPAPEMMEDDDEQTVTLSSFDKTEDALQKQLSAFGFTPSTPALVAPPPSPMLSRTPSLESLIDPHFDSPSSPPLTTSLPATPISPTSSVFGLPFPVPPMSPARHRIASFLAMDDEADVFFDCSDSKSTKSSSE
ncbi:hypothetical protein JCM1840_005992 [Sporobolomyces johnsonii]